LKAFTDELSRDFPDDISSLPEMDLLTYFSVAPPADDIPSIMPSPFSNTPHPLAQQACRILQQRLPAFEPTDVKTSAGKMYGVLVVRDADGRIGFISAFSGMASPRWQMTGFVPPIFNQMELDRFLPAGSNELAVLTGQLQELEESLQGSGLMQQISHMRQQRDQALAALKQRHQAAKAERKKQRLGLQQLADADEQHKQMAALALASQQQKRETINASLHWEEKLLLLQQQLDVLEQQIARTREARTEKSRQLHQQVFATYVLDNRLHERQAITHFFADGLPPAGTGDCAGPKLIHYAHHHQLQPLALAEFWWGASPANGVRHHGHYYPACRGKCLPILPFMLRGLNVEPEPDYGRDTEAREPEIVYEDDAILVINKPAGLMSVPGKYVKDSVLSRMQQSHPDCPELRLMHRLDMGTSGLLLAAKTLQANRFLHKQFIQHRVDKRYEAVLSKALSSDQSEGEIDLPLRVDLDDRPRQMVCFEHGKPAKTRWQVIAHSGEDEAETTRVWFYPQTGRTHQLRVHAAHQDGLNAPIVGDDLYGRAGGHLLLHAQRLCFTHPVSRERMEFEVSAPF